MKAKYPVISTCPVCNHELKVVKLECDHCGTAIEGDFTLSKFNYMNQEKLYFIEIFIKNRGNIKAIEKELNISYPTVKKMLDDVINELGYDADLDFDQKEDEAEVVNEKIQSKAEVVKKLKNKEISALEAVELLKKIK